MMNMVPTFTTKGFVNDPVIGMSEVMSIYFANKRSQSDQFIVQSIARDIAESPEDAVTLSIIVRNSLIALYKAYFPDGVDVDVTATYDSTIEHRKYRLGVNVTCYVDGIPYSLGKTYTDYNGGFKELTEQG